MPGHAAMRREAGRSRYGTIIGQPGWPTHSGHGQSMGGVQIPSQIMKPQAGSPKHSGHMQSEPPAQKPSLQVPMPPQMGSYCVPRS